MACQVMRGKFVLGLLALLSANVIVADEILLPVPEGTTSLAAALTAAGSSLAALNGGADAAKTIRKTGGGTLTFTTKLPNWTGDLHVDGGVAWVSGLATAVGNADAGEVFVADGATIVIDAAIDSVESSGPKRPIHVQGAGASGEKGAIRSRIGSSGNFLRACLPFHLVLDGDATWAFDRPSTGSSPVFDNGRVIDMQGKTLTLTNDGTTDKKADVVYFDDVKLPLSDSPAMIVSGLRACLRGADFGGDETCTFTLRDGSSLSFADGRRSKGFRWKLVVDETADARALRPANSAGTMYNNWYGPVQLGRDLSMENSVALGSTVDFTFFGKVSGAHSVYGGAEYVATSGDRMYRISFAADGNDFTEGLWFTNATLAIRSKQALGDIQGGITLVNSSVQGIDTNLSAVLQGTSERFELPSMTFESKKASDVVTVAPSEYSPFAFLENTGTLTKTGDGSLEISASVTGGTLDIRKGTVKFVNPTPEQKMSSLRGLVAGYVDKPDGSMGYTGGIDRAPYKGFLTNEVVKVPDIFNPGDLATIVGPERVYKSYNGYIWNHGDEPVSYTFACAIHCYYELKIGDTLVKNPALKALADGGNDGTVTTVTLPPGPTPFSFRYGAQYNSNPNCYAVATNNLLASWPKDWFLVYDPQGRGSRDPADYQVISNDFAQPLFTCMLPEDADKVDLSSSFDVIRGEPGTTLDLDGRTMDVGIVEGDFEVVNGTLNIVSTGTVSRIDFGTGSSRLAGRRRLREQSAGLWYGSYKPSGTSESPQYFGNLLTDPNFNYLMSNEVASVLEPFCHVNDWPPSGSEYAEQWKATVPYWADDANRYKTWSGFVWNDSPTQETWTVVHSMNSYAELYIGETRLYQDMCTDGRSGGLQAGTNGVPPNTYKKINGKTAQMTLQPGPNRFSLRYYNRWNTYGLWVGNVATNLNNVPFAYWVEGHGLMFDRKGRGTTDMHDFEPFEDFGTGTLLTRDDAVGTLTVTAATADGAVIDVDGTVTHVTGLAGYLAASNGTILVTDTWTLAKDQVESDHAVATGVDFAEGVTFKIADDAKLARKSAGGYYVLARAADFTAVPTLDPAYPDAARWSVQKVAVEGGYELRLVRAECGLMLIVR